MAVLKYSSATGAMTRDDYVDNLDRSIELLWMRRDESKGVLSQFFDVQDTESDSFKVSSVSSVVRMPVENEDTEELPYVQPAPGYSKTFTLVNYRVAIRVTDTLIRSDRFGRIVAMCGGLMKSADRRLEYLRASIFNNAFTGTDGADAFSLCYDSHPNEDPQSGNWDNLGTGALTGANLQALRLLASKMENEIGAPDECMLKTLLVPPDLEQKAQELTTASLTAETALNTPTVLIKNLQVVKSPHLTSTTAYFGIGDRAGENKGIHELYLMRPELANVGNNPVDIPIDKRVKFIVKMGFTTSRNVYGSAGT